MQANQNLSYFKN